MKTLTCTLNGLTGTLFRVPPAASHHWVYIEPVFAGPNLRPIRGWMRVMANSKPHLQWAPENVGIASFN